VGEPAVGAASQMLHEQDDIVEETSMDVPIGSSELQSFLVRKLIQAYALSGKSGQES